MAPASKQQQYQQEGAPSTAPQLAPDLLVAWEPFWPVFIANLADILLRREPTPLVLTSRPATFWPDVFVNRPLPWKNFLQSGSMHLGLILLIYTTGHLWFARQPKLQDQYLHTTITYYRVAEELPPIVNSTPAPKAKQARKGEPELAKQEIISVPTNADNSTQTIMNPPHPKVLRQEVPLPNMMVWTTVPAPPVAALRSQVTLPKMTFTPVQPAPDTSQLRQQNRFKMATEKIQVAESQPELDALKTKRSDLTLASAPDAVQPAPKLDLPLQRSVSGSELSKGAQNAVPPPPSLGAPSTGQQAAGQLLSLSVRPTPPAGDIKVPDGSRSGVFAASPTGRAGAAGTPSLPASGGPAENGTGTNDSRAAAAGGNGNGASSVPGISVTGGSTTAPTGPVVAAAAPPAAPKATSPFTRYDRPPVPLYPPANKEDRKIENQVFGGRKSYSMSLNMANLTSSGGSWIIRFAELKESHEQGELSTPTVMNKVDPAYPSDLIKEQVEGVVTLYAVIHADGSVGEVRLLQGIHERLDENAMKALVRWHFRPAMKNGVAVDLEAVVSVPFKARRMTGF
ncbi:MAG TPA: TonB family protein [Terriglobales bacterium]|nr:TonB family protein [Terriglobales bacterium]